MIISHNLQAMNTNRIVNANINAHAKSTRKISSGYQINRAVDNPVGLAMSETMRKQIRGLMQGINNTKDGRAFVQIADGAMDEVHAMLQRMNELSLKALNGLCTTEDRAALNAEFDQLRTEIDRINDTTTFNTMPVFDKHEASYYQIAGNRQWDDNQLHVITPSENQLNIHLPDGYEPKDYTITVPAGTYTTQELMDEIDDALNKMDPPNPGFVFEYTSDGYCNLNFENADGEPTKIKFIDGPLAYLIYDFQPGGSPASLLGTSQFEGNKELEIAKGQNDELGFYAESAKDPDKYIFITIEPGYYNREAMINKINEKLAEIEGTEGIVAKPYGDFYIQITGGDTINITGLKGNMFKYEPPGSPKVYSSVFYDNEVYGDCDKDNAKITGYSHTRDIRIYDSTANQNNILYFQLDGDSANMKTITLPAGDYSVEELVDVVNEQLEKEGLDDKVEAIYTDGKLQLVSKKLGTRSELIFPVNYATDSNPDKIYRKTYETLFRSRSGSPTITGQPASVTGAASLSGTITLASDATLSFDVDGTTYTVGSDIIGGSHASLGSLISKLNSFITNNTNLNGKVVFDSSGSQLVLRSLPDTGIKSISVLNTNDAYRTLFMSTYTTLNGSFSGMSWGFKGEIQGFPGTYNISPASISASPCQQPITLDANSTQIAMTLYNSDTGEQRTISFNLDADQYNDINALKDEINSKLGTSGSPYAGYINVTASGSALTFTFTPPGDNSMSDGDWRISLSSTPAWKAIFGERELTTGPYTRPAGDAVLTAAYPAFNEITLNSVSRNNQLHLESGGRSCDITINGTYTNRSALVNALQAAIASSPLNGIVTASLSGSNIRLSAMSNTLVASGTFYNEVICKGIVSSPSYYQQKGTCDFDSTCIIGRRDLTTESVEIIAGFNDTLSFDFTYNKDADSPEEEFESFVKTVNVTIPEGMYPNGYAIVNALNEAVKQQFGKDGELSGDDIFGTDGDFDITFSIGGYQTQDVHNSIDQFALQIKVDRKNGEEPGEGEYIIDGVRGNASCFTFYKTASLPKATYIVGTKDIREGVIFEPGKNVFTLSANSEPYQYTFEENKYYTADEFIDELNRRFTEGDDNGNSAPLRATLEDGAVKIWHKTIGANTITDIDGSARSTIFFEEEGRDSRNPLILQVGAEQRSTIEIPRIRVDSASLSINSITISQEKYAEKAVEHIKSAIKTLSDRRSIYGAMQNRLDYTINNNDNVAEQVQASESRIRDVDISSELIRYSNLNILLQAGHKMIAHSNNNINKLLTLLG